MSWLDGWNYRKKINITGQSGAGTGYQVKLLVGESSGASGDDFDLGGLAENFPSDKNEGGDLRFTCFSNDTEVLTENGWKLIKDIVDKKERVKIATLNSKTNNLEYQYPYDYIKYWYNGKMLHQSGRILDFLVTPEHRIWARKEWVKRRKNNHNNFEFIRAKDLPRHIEYQVSSDWEGIYKKYFYLPEVVKRNGKRENTLLKEKKILMDDWLKFFGFWLAEGSVFKNKSHYTIYLTQKSKENLYEFELFCKKYDFNYSYLKVTNSFTLRITNIQLYNYLKQFGKSYEKFIPQEILNLSKYQLLILLKYLVKGDGYIRKNNINYFTTSKKLADNMQELALKCGYSSVLTIRKGGSLAFEKYKRRDGYVIFLTKRTNIKANCIGSFDRRKWINYKNYVYCLNVPNHLLFIRRNGKTIWSGNCDDGVTELNFWVQEVTGTTPNRVATIWVKVNDNLDSNQAIYCYFSNPQSGLANASNGDNTFEFFDDFSGAVLDTSKWNTSDTPAVDGSDNAILDNDDNLIGKTSFGLGYEVRARSKADEQDSTFAGFADDAFWDMVEYALNSNTDGQSPDNFDEFVLGVNKSGGGSENFTQDNWNDFRNTYYEYFLKRIASDNITWGQANNTHTYTTSNNIPISNLYPVLFVWDNTQESTLTVDWVFVKKVIATEPSFDSAEAEEDGDPTATTQSATNIGTTIATLNGDFTLAKQSEIETWFEYRKNLSGESWTQTAKVIKTVDGSHTANISGLDQGTEYIFKLVVQSTASGSSEVDGSELTFTTNYGTISYANKAIIKDDIIMLVGEESPAKIAKIDISSGTPTWYVYTMDDSGENFHNPKDLVLNETFNQIYVACDYGKVAKIDYTDFTSREEIEVESGGSGASEMETIDCVDDLQYTFIGTNASTAELYRIDESTMVKINCDLRFLKKVVTKIKTYLFTLFAKKINCDLRFFVQQKKFIKTDLRFLTQAYDEIEPTKKREADGSEGFLIKINDSVIPNDDVDYDSIRIIFTENENSFAHFTLARRHDKPDYTIEGNYCQITNQNSIKIYFNNRQIWEGAVSEWHPKGSTERINVVAKGNKADTSNLTENRRRQVVNLPLPSLNEQLHPYHVIIDDIQIYNPVIDYDEDNPTYYKGIRVDKGMEEWEIIRRKGEVPTGSLDGGWHSPFVGGVGLDPFYDDGAFFKRPATLEEFEDPDTGKINFKPKQNWTYFYFVSGYKHKVINYQDEYGNDKVKIVTSEFTNQYIGTSLAPLHSDLYTITSIYACAQQELDNLVLPLGDYEIGSAPYQEISVKNGIYNSVPKWVDREDGLYLVQNNFYNHMTYLEKVAYLEYKKLPNIPETSVNLTLTIDGYLYYGLKLLNRINITNTTQAGVYKNNNGFPVTIKEIEISSKDMQVHIRTDNQKSNRELELIDGAYPDDPEEFTVPWFKLVKKYDLQREQFISDDYSGDVDHSDDFIGGGFSF